MKGLKLSYFRLLPASYVDYDEYDVFVDWHALLMESICSRRRTLPRLCSL